LELLVIYPRGGPLGEHRLLLSRIVSGVFTDPLPNNRHPNVGRVGSRGNVFTESLPSNGSIRHNIVTCYATEDAVRIVNSSITIPITRNYNHSQLSLMLLRVYTIIIFARS
jgi:hypothetical protein